MLATSDICGNFWNGTAPDNSNQLTLTSEPLSAGMSPFNF